MFTRQVGTIKSWGGYIFYRKKKLKGGKKMKKPANVGARPGGGNRGTATPHSKKGKVRTGRLGEDRGNWKRWWQKTSEKKNFWAKFGLGKGVGSGGHMIGTIT